MTSPGSPAWFEQTKKGSRNTKLSYQTCNFSNNKTAIQEVMADLSSHPKLRSKYSHNQLVMFDPKKHDNIHATLHAQKKIILHINDEKNYKDLSILRQPNGNNCLIMSKGFTGTTPEKTKQFYSVLRDHIDDTMVQIVLTIIDDGNLQV